MKKVIITLLLSLMMTNMFSFTFQTEYNYQVSTFSTTSSYIPYNNSQSIEYRRIGYTINYSNGQFNSTQYYQGTYNPSQSSSGRRPGQPRRVKGYTDDGKETGSITSGPEQGTGMGRGESFWEDGYKYYYNEDKDRWYRKDSDENVSEWDNPWVFTYLGWHWTLLYGHTVPDGSTQGYRENPVPIGDNYIWFIVCIVSIYSLIKWIKLKRLTN